MRTIKWKNGVVMTVDQTRLPHKLVFLKLYSCREVASAIRKMKIRGAPLIGVAAAYGLALTAFHSKARNNEKLLTQLESSSALLRRTRPTAVNLFWATARVMNIARANITRNFSQREVVDSVVFEAQKMADEDIQANRKIGEHGSKLINEGDTVLTHCNAGSLATVEYGTALAVIRTAWHSGKKIDVFATETRPKLQGSRLTAYELKREGIPTTLITDSTVGYLMFKHMINKVVVGADRIVRDAIINKIGTFTIAVLAYEHEVPFYVAAPISTFDMERSSKEIIIEERSSDEVTQLGSQRLAPKGINVLNLAFDITPMKYVSGIICENGVVSPTGEGFRDLYKRGNSAI